MYIHAFCVNKLLYKTKEHERIKEGVMEVALSFFPASFLFQQGGYTSKIANCGVSQSHYA